MGNAIEFTTSGEVALLVSLDDEDDENVMVRFQVKDTGIGIPKARLDVLFLPFTQADGSVARHFGGTGLSLSISKQLAEMMEGQIGVESVVGKGSTFWFTAGLVKQPDQGAGAMDIAADEELQEKRILVLDDNATNRQVMAYMLNSWKCRHDSAPDAETVLKKFRAAARSKDTFHIAALNMRMPGTTGKTLGKPIRRAAAVLYNFTLSQIHQGRSSNFKRRKRPGQNWCSNMLLGSDGHDQDLQDLFDYRD